MNDLQSGQVKSLLEQLKRLKQPDQHLYLVGGAIRDSLLDLPIYDLDFVGDADLVKLARSFANANGAAFYVMDAGRGAYRVLLGGGEKRLIVDFTRMQGAGVEEDLAARDFTVNAIAVDVDESGMYIDPLKGGRDLQEKVLRLCSPASISNDPVRILRLLRIAVQFGMRIDPDALAAAKNDRHRLGETSIERRRDQLFKMLSLRNAATALALVTRLELTGETLPTLTTDLLSRSLPLMSHLDTLLSWLTFGHDAGTSGNLLISQVLIHLGRHKQQISDFLREQIIEGRDQASLLKLSLLHMAGDAQPVEEIAAAYALSVPEGRLIAAAASHANDFEDYLQHNSTDLNRYLHRYFKRCGQAGVYIALLMVARAMEAGVPLTDEPRWKRLLTAAEQIIEAWFNRQEEVISPRKLLDGDQIMRQFGVQAGPGLGEILRKLEEEQAAGVVMDIHQAKTFVKSLIEG